MVFSDTGFSRVLGSPAFSYQENLYQCPMKSQAGKLVFSMQRFQRKMLNH